jgi:hypothetical protein
MEKEFVTYEQALALKELGFKEDVLAWYDTENKLLNTGSLWQLFKNDDDFVLAPLKQQVFRWFREKYKLVHEIQFGDGKIWIRYGYNSYLRALELDNNNNEFFHTYEEAENACIDKLIELAKNK